jgi:hypothetical protein
LEVELEFDSDWGEMEGDFRITALILERGEDMERGGLVAISVFLLGVVEECGLFVRFGYC